MNILTIRNSSKDKYKINNNNKESKKQKTTKIKKYSLSHQNSLSKLKTTTLLSSLKFLQNLIAPQSAKPELPPF